MINTKAVLQFKADLWKDQRGLEIKEKNGKKVFLIKHYESEEEAACEQQVIYHLEKILGAQSVPSLIETTSTTSTLQYIYGIRIFNLIVDLDNAPAEFTDTARQLKRLIVSRCDAKQRQIQSALYLLPDVKTKPPYPLEKVGAIVEILAECLGIDWDKEEIGSELKYLKSIWEPSVCVPFRDSATKNMVLASCELWLGNFTSEDQRRELLYDSIKNNTYQKWMESPIVDYDFCSCIHNTTPEDDVISIRFHERTWMGPPTSATDTVWDFEPNPKRAAISFLVRYFRFGGRKAAYRLLHPTGHRIRFRHDSDTFYFEKLPGLMKLLWPEVVSIFPGLLEFTDILRRNLPLAQPDIDYFLAIQPLEKRDYYIDVYPN